MTYSRQNGVEEQQEACRKAKQIIALCEDLHITLDPIDWQHYGMRAPVKVNSIEIASLLALSQRTSNDILRCVQIKLFERAALESIHARAGLKALIWSPVEVVQPQAFLSLWIVTLETDERIPIMECIRNGQRVYEHYRLDPDDGQQLAMLFGPASEGEYHLGERVTIKERERHYTGAILYIFPAGKVLPGRKDVSRGSGTASSNEVASRYVVDCNDGFPHIVYQSQIIT